jgi:hypothetical protein
MQKLGLILSLLLIAAFCKNSNQTKQVEKEKQPAAMVYKTIGTIPVPDGFRRMNEHTDSFGVWLRTIPLKKDKTVYLFNGLVKANQNAQFAVIDISVGDKDLQQCADAVMRLRAEYLYAQNRGMEFVDFGGRKYKWPGQQGSREKFENYLQNVFGWCGSASLEKQLKRVQNFSSLSVGDVFIKGGFPGHAMLVADVAINEKGNKVYLLMQSYMPAQSIHIVVNPMNDKMSPWYEVNNNENIITPEYSFKKLNLRTW